MEFSKTVVPFLHVTTRIEGRKDEDLLSRKGGTGFPYFVVLDAQGELLAQHNGPRTVEGFQATVAKGQEFLDLVAKAEAGDEQAQIELAMVEAELGRIDYEAAKKRLEGRTLTAEQSARLERLRLKSVVMEHLAKLQGAPRGDATALNAAGEAFYPFLAAGATPESGTMEANVFLQVLAGWTENLEDVAKLEKIHAYLKAELAGNERAKPFLDGLATRIRDLKDGASGEEEPAEEEDDGETDIEEGN